MAPRTDLDEEVVAALSIALPRLEGVHVVRAQSLSRLTALRVGGPADLIVHVETPEALIAAARLMKRVSCPWRVAWPFDPNLARDGGAAGAVVTVGSAFEGLTAGPEGSVVLGAATPFSALAAAGPDFAQLARWPGTPGGLLSSGLAERLAGPCAVVTSVTGVSIRRRTVATTAAPPNPARTTVPVSVQLRPIPPAAVRPMVPGQLLEPDTSLARVGGSVDEISHTMVEVGLSESRLRGWTVSKKWPGVVVQSGTGTTRDLELFARGLAEKLHRERGLLTRMAPRTWGRPPMSTRSRSRK